MKRKFSLAKEESHGDRPWVFFMVDCFFLITEFFVLTFKFKAEESALPRQLPPGGTVPGGVARSNAINVHVANSEYVVMGQSRTRGELEQILASAAQLQSNVGVSISYDSAVSWGNVMAVFNACTKVKIAECGLVPLRGSDPKAAD